ncbi:disease resistance protein RUN1 isoform X2 [Manihot esculenta]|uniref:Uncharacterized protein n=1 Tax=Manihot esculenta TaxID=3983 RepID=A0ACB7GI15_MANES|nr:disease resistance protein RUN1 isoform X2 [Manihot esculenta]KAG8639892.1 hypothetical protein MANES_13G002500v8 [Manihot esculenta]
MASNGAVSSSSSSSSSSLREWKYDAFLSFRGEDIRKSFISHLHKELSREGINTFIDDRELETGQSISQTLTEAIRSSRILIIILSKNYASSRWCLDELVQILKCKKAGSQTVLPIFYDVSPSQVRKQSGNFENAFDSHGQLFKEKVQQWRDAIMQVADLCGWDLHDRDESEFICEIVKDIISKLGRFSSDIAKGLVGMESRSEKMRMYLDLGQPDKVKFIGVWGMGGIGKTTIASVVYKQLHSQFEGSSFLIDVREASKRHNGLVSLQNKLLSAILNRDLEVHDVHKGTDELRKRLCHKKVLVILDDVNELEQLEYLIGKRDENWFGKGSRIVITTRNKHLLAQCGLDDECIYRMEELADHEAFQLFCSKAFRNNCPTVDYMELCNQFVSYASGLPLALSVLGSSLYAKSIKEWKSALDRLKDIPSAEILRKLQISFDGLDEMQKKLFLDIACFFNGREENYVRKILESCGFYPDSGIGELMDKSLIIVSNERVWMHDLLRQMSQEIVRRESPKEPGRRSRIWLYEDVYHVLINDTGSEENEGIVLDLLSETSQLIRAKGFSKMKYLRLLILQNAFVFHDLEYLSNELRYLEWHKYPFKSFPSTFQPNKLVELNMQHSKLKQLWKAVKPLQLLKIIDLSFSKDLIKTPDFRDVPNLEVLKLQGCTSLVEVHKCIGVLRRFFSLNLKDCKNLVALPSDIWNLKSLKILNLRGCLKLSKLPEGLAGLTSLEELDAAGIGSRQMTFAKPWDLLSNFLPHAERNQNLQAFAFSSLRALRKLDLSCCNLPKVPNDISYLRSLVKLNLSGNYLLSVPSSISELSNLKDVDFSNCTRLRSLPALPSSVECLDMKNCTSLQTLPNLVQVLRLKTLKCANCKSLRSLPHLPSSVKFLDMENCTALAIFPNLIETHNVEKSFYIGFSKFSKLNYFQGEIRVPFTWLRYYMLWLHDVRQLLKMQRRIHPFLGLPDFYLCLPGSGICHQRSMLSFLELPEFYICLPGSGIPDWFKHQAEESHLRIELHPNESWWNIAGFVVCAVVEKGNVGEPITWSITVGRNIGSARCWSNHVPIPETSQVPSDHLSMFFQVNQLVDPNDECSPTELLLIFEPEEKIKKCGIRIVYEVEIQEIIQMNRPLKDLVI